MTNSNTDTKSADRAVAAAVLNERHGRFVLLHARSNPAEIVHEVLTAWDERPLKTGEHLPTFRNAFNVDDLLTDVEAFVGARTKFEVFELDPGAAEDLVREAQVPALVAADFDKFSITQLRQASRGRIKGGYGLPKTDLIAALIGAGLSPSDV